MSHLSLLNKLPLVAGSTLVVLAAGVSQGKAATLYSDRTAFESELGTFIVDDYSDPDYATGDKTNLPTLDFHSDESMSNVLGETSYKTTGFNDSSVIVFSDSDPAYCAGCNGSFLLDFTETSVGDDSGVYGVGFDIFAVENTLTDEPYFAFVTYGDGNTEEFSLEDQSGSFFGLTSETSIATIHIGLQGGASTVEGYFIMDNLTIGSAAEVSAVPEPASIVGLLMTSAGMGLLGRRKAEQSA